ncbi:hypothetical protein ACIBTV_24445 [Micromonospora sp. NPDC049366]|uniref:hypothetical protein n=1 Tax=Micromonospora sp. NPDC049366 TaxID=3364271 RepID=UPI0037A19D3A
MYKYAKRWLDLGDAIYEYFLKLAFPAYDISWSGAAREKALEALEPLGKLLVNQAQDPSGQTFLSAARMVWNIGESINWYADKLQEQRKKEEAEAAKQAVLAFFMFALLFIPMVSYFRFLQWVLSPVTRILTRVAALFSTAQWPQRAALVAGMAIDGAWQGVAIELIATGIGAGAAGIKPEIHEKHVGIAAGIGAGLGAGLGLIFMGGRNVPRALPGQANRGGLGGRPGGDPMPPKPGVTSPAGVHTPITQVRPTGGGLVLPPRSVEHPPITIRDPDGLLPNPANTSPAPPHAPASGRRAGAEASPRVDQPNSAAPAHVDPVATPPTAASHRPVSPDPRFPGHGQTLGAAPAVRADPPLAAGHLPRSDAPMPPRGRETTSSDGAVPVNSSAPPRDGATSVVRGSGGGRTSGLAGENGNAVPILREGAAPRATQSDGGATPTRTVASTDPRFPGTGRTLDGKPGFHERHPEPNVAASAVKPNEPPPAPPKRQRMPPDTGHVIGTTSGVGAPPRVRTGSAPDGAAFGGAPIDAPSPAPQRSTSAARNSGEGRSPAPAGEDGNGVSAGSTDSFVGVANADPKFPGVGRTLSGRAPDAEVVVVSAPPERQVFRINDVTGQRELVTLSRPKEMPGHGYTLDEPRGAPLENPENVTRFTRPAPPVPEGPAPRPNHGSESAGPHRYFEIDPHTGAAAPTRVGPGERILRVEPAGGFERRNVVVKGDEKVPVGVPEERILRYDWGKHRWDVDTIPQRPAPAAEKPYLVSGPNGRDTAGPVAEPEPDFQVLRRDGDGNIDLLTYPRDPVRVAAGKTDGYTFQEFGAGAPGWREGEFLGTPRIERVLTTAHRLDGVPVKQDVVLVRDPQTGAWTPVQGRAGSEPTVAAPRTAHPSYYRVDPQGEGLQPVTVKGNALPVVKIKGDGTVEETNFSPSGSASDGDGLPNLRVDENGHLMREAPQTIHPEQLSFDPNSGNLTFRETKPYEPSGGSGGAGGSGGGPARGGGGGGLGKRDNGTGSQTQTETRTITFTEDRSPQVGGRTRDETPDTPVSEPRPEPSDRVRASTTDGVSARSRPENASVRAEAASGSRLESSGRPARTERPSSATDADGRVDAPRSARSAPTAQSAEGAVRHRAASPHGGSAETPPNPQTPHSQGRPQPVASHADNGEIGGARGSLDQKPVATRSGSTGSAAASSSGWQGPLGSGELPPSDRASDGAPLYRADGSADGSAVVRGERPVLRLRPDGQSSVRSNDGPVVAADGVTVEPSPAPRPVRKDGVLDRVAGPDPLTSNQRSVDPAPRAAGSQSDGTASPLGGGGSAPDTGATAASGVLGTGVGIDGAAPGLASGGPRQPAPVPRTGVPAGLSESGGQSTALPDGLVYVAPVPPAGHPAQRLGENPVRLDEFTPDPRRGAPRPDGRDRASQVSDPAHSFGVQPPVVLDRVAVERLVDEVADRTPPRRVGAEQPDPGRCVELLSAIQQAIYPRRVPVARSLGATDDRTVGTGHVADRLGGGATWHAVSSWAEVERAVTRAGVGSTALVLWQQPRGIGHAFALHHITDPHRPLQWLEPQNPRGERLVTSDALGSPAAARVLILDASGAESALLAPAGPESGSTARAIIDAPTDHRYGASRHAGDGRIAETDRGHLGGPPARRPSNAGAAGAPPSASSAALSGPAARSSRGPAPEAVPSSPPVSSPVTAAGQTFERVPVRGDGWCMLTSAVLSVPARLAGLLSRVDPSAPEPGQSRTAAQVFDSERRAAEWLMTVERRLGEPGGARRVLDDGQLSATLQAIAGRLARMVRRPEDFGLDPQRFGAVSIRAGLPSAQRNVDTPITDGDRARLARDVADWGRTWESGRGDGYPVLLADALGVRLVVASPGSPRGYVNPDTVASDASSPVLYLMRVSDDHYDGWIPSRPPVAPPWPALSGPRRGQRLTIDLPLIDPDEHVPVRPEVRKELVERARRAVDRPSNDPVEHIRSATTMGPTGPARTSGAPLELSEPVELSRPTELNKPVPPSSGPSVSTDREPSGSPAPWYVRQGALGAMRVVSAGYPDPGVRAAEIMRVLPDRVGGLVVSPALRDGVVRQLESLLGIAGHRPGGPLPTSAEQLADLASGVENVKRWDALLREGWTGVIDGRLVWIKPRLGDVQSQVVKKGGGQETKFVVVFGSTAAEATQERSSGHAGTVGPDALFSVGKALIPLQVPFEFDYQRSTSSTSTYRVLSGRKLFFNGGAAFTSGLAVDLYVDGVRWGTGTVPRAADGLLIVQFPSPYLTQASPTPRPSVGHAAGTAEVGAKAMGQPAGAHEVLTAIHLDPAVASLHRALRASNLPPAAAAVVAERFTRMLLNERTALARSRWLLHHGDSSEELIVPIDAGRDFRGHLTVEFAVKRLQYLDTASEVSIRDDLGVVRGTSTSSTTARSASVPLPRVSGSRKRHGGGGPAVEMNFGRAVDGQVGSQGMNHPILVRTSDHERHAAEIQVNLKFTSETHRVGWQSELVWAEFGVPKDERTAFEVRHLGQPITAPGTWHDAVVPSMAVTPAALRDRAVTDDASQLGRERQNAPQVREPYRPSAPSKAGGPNREPLALAARRGDGVGTTIGLPGGHLVAPYVMAALREAAGWQVTVREHVGVDDFSPGTPSWAQVQFRVGLRYGLMALEADAGRLKTGIHSTFDIHGRSFHVLVTARTLDLVGERRYRLRVNDRALSTVDTGTGVTTSVGGYLGLAGSVILGQDWPVQLQIPVQVGVGYEQGAERSRSRSVKSYRRFETDGEVVQFDYTLAYEITVWTDPATPHRWQLVGEEFQQQVVVSDELLPKASPSAAAGEIRVEVFPSGRRPPAVPNSQEPVPFHSQGVSGVYPRFVELPELPALVARLYGEVTGRDGGWHRNPRNWPAELWDAGLAVPTELGAFFADLTAGDHRWRITLDGRADRTTVVEISARVYDVTHLGDSTGVEVEQYAQASSQFDSGTESEWSGRAAVGLGPMARLGRAGQGGDDESSGHTAGGYGAPRYSRSWSSSTATGSGSIDITRATYKGQVHTYRAGRVRFEVTVTTWAGGKAPTRRSGTLDLHNGLEFHVPNRIAWGLGLPHATDTGTSPSAPAAGPLRRELDPHLGRASSHVEQLRSDTSPLTLILDTLADRGVLAREGQGPPDPLRESLSRTFSMAALELQAFALFGSGVGEWFTVPGPFGTGYLFVRVSAALGTVRSDRERPETNLTLRGESIESDDRDTSTGTSTALAAAVRGRGSFATGVAGAAGRYEHTWDTSRSQGQEHSVTTIFRHGTKKSHEFVNDVHFTIDLRYTLRTGTWEDRRSTSGSVRRLVPHTLTAPAGPPAGSRGPQWEPVARVGQPTDVSRRHDSPQLEAGLNRLVADDPTFIPLALPLSETLRRDLAQALTTTGTPARTGTGLADYLRGLTAAQGLSVTRLPGRAWTGLTDYLRGLTAFSVGAPLVDADQFVAESNLRPRVRQLLAHQYQVPGTPVRLGIVLTEAAQLLDDNGLPLTPTYKSRQYTQDETTPVTGRGTASGAHGGVIPEIAGRDIGPATLIGGRGGWKGTRDGGRDATAELAETSEYNTESSANHTYYRYRLTVVAHLPGGRTVSFPSADGLYGLSRRSPEDLMAANPTLSDRLVNGRVLTRERLARTVDRAVGAAGLITDGPRVLAALTAHLYPAGVGGHPVNGDAATYLPAPDRWQTPPSREAAVALVRSSPPGSSALILHTDGSAGYIAYHTAEGEIHWIDPQAAPDARLTRVTDASTGGAPLRVPGAGQPSDLRVVIIGPDGSLRPAPPRRPSLDTSVPPSSPLSPSAAAAAAAAAAASAPTEPDLRDQHPQRTPAPATPTPASGTTEAGEARDRAALTPLPHPLRHVAEPEQVRTAPRRTTDHQLPEQPTTTGSASGGAVPPPPPAPARTAPPLTTTTVGGGLGGRPAGPSVIPEEPERLEWFASGPRLVGSDVINSSLRELPAGRYVALLEQARELHVAPPSVQVAQQVRNIAYALHRFGAEEARRVAQWYATGTVPDGASRRRLPETPDERVLNRLRDRIEAAIGSGGDDVAPALFTARFPVGAFLPADAGNGPAMPWRPDMTGPGWRQAVSWAEVAALARQAGSGAFALVRLQDAGPDAVGLHVGSDEARSLWIVHARHGTTPRYERFDESRPVEGLGDPVRVAVIDRCADVHT